MIEELIDLIKRFEGCRLEAYYDSAGILTVGWGHTGKDVNKYTVWTQSYADHILQKEAEYFWVKSAEISPILYAHDSAHVAIASFTYNMGLGRYKASTLRRKIDKGDFEGAKIEIKRWIFGGGRKLPGLIRRRLEESLLL